MDSDILVMDATLQEYLKAHPNHPSNRSLVIHAANVLKEQVDNAKDDGRTVCLADHSPFHQLTWLQSLAVAYLRSCIKEGDESIFRLIQIELDDCSNPEANAIKNEMQQPPKKPTATQASSTQLPRGKLHMKDHIWRPEIKRLMSRILSPDPLAWMDDEFRPNEAHFIKRVLNDISDRFSRYFRALSHSFPRLNHHLQAS